MQIHNFRILNFSCMVMFYLSFCGSIYSSKIPPPKGVGVSVAAWACRYARTGEALGPSEKGKTWERRGKKWTLYIILNYVMLYYIIFYSPVSTYQHLLPWENNGKQLRQLGFPVPTNPKTQTRVAWLHLSTAISYGPTGPIPEI